MSSVCHRGHANSATRFALACLALCVVLAGGWAAAAPVISVTPTSNDFGNVEIATAKVFAQTFTVKNTGDADLILEALSITGADTSSFTILNDNCSGVTLAADASATVDVRFKPASIGAKSANLSIPATGLATVDVPLTGKAIVTNVAGMSDAGRIFVAFNYLDGTFDNFKDIGVDIGEYCRAIAIDDFDNDGDNDILAGAGNNNNSTATYYYFQNNGDGTFTNKGTAFTVREGGSWAMDVCAGDFNNDGKMDVIANGHTRGATIFFGNGDGTFTFGNLVCDYDLRASDAADFNHDGKLDFALASYGDGYIRVYLGDGTGLFTSSYVGDVGLDPYGVTVGDFDNDGHADIIATADNGGPTYFFKGKGDGTFFPGGLSASLSTTDWRAYDAYDYDRDGNVDILMYRQNAKEMWWQPGNGNGSFGTAVKLSTFDLGNGLTCAAPFAVAGYGAPTAAVTPRTATVPIAGTVNFDASASGGTIASYDWIFGDGGTGAGATASHSYTTEGVRCGTVKVIDANGMIDYAAFTVTVQGNPPVSEANGPYTFGEQYLSNGAWTATLDGTGSSDNESAVKYEWDFGDSFSDNFDDGNSSGWTPYGGTWTEANGVYEQTATTQAHLVTIFTAGNKLADLTVEADVTPISGMQHSYLLFRVKDSINLYYLCLRGYGYDDALIYRVINGGHTSIGARPLPFAVANGKTYHLEVVCQGTHIEGYINGVLAVEADDTFFSSGYAGLAAHGTDVKFDNFKVTSAPGITKNPTHVYRKGPGTYTATLKVTDASGQTATDTAAVNLVYNDPPVANAGGPYSATEQQSWAGRWPVQLDGSSSSDDVEIVDYNWTVESDDFTGTTLNSRWLIGGAAQNDQITFSGSGWGSHYLVNKHLVTRDEGGSVAVQATVKLAPGTTELMFGFKNTSGDCSYTQLPYALYLYAGNSTVNVYEDGTNRGATGYTFSANTWYDVRVELKYPAGARYYYRPTGSSDWAMV